MGKLYPYLQDNSTEFDDNHARELLRHMAFHPSEVFEMRIIFTDGRPPLVGFFRDPEYLIPAARNMNGEANIYIGLNPRPNRFLEQGPANELGRGYGAKDADIELLRNFLVDIDSKHPKEHPATDEERLAALEVAERVWDFFEQRGVECLRGFSGNGWISDIRMKDVTNTTGASERIKALGTYLAQKFDTPAAKVDITVYNPSRLVRLPGSLNVKGTATADRPHRLARLFPGGVK